MQDYLNKSDRLDNYHAGFKNQEFRNQDFIMFKDWEYGLSIPIHTCMQSVAFFLDPDEDLSHSLNWK